MYNVIGSAAAAALILTGCAIKPIPDNVTGIPTDLLVERVRCEVQQSILNILRAYLEVEGAAAAPVTPPQVEELQQALSKKNYSKFSYATRKYLETYDDALIVLDFQLRMTEKNGLGGGTTIARPFTGGLDLLGFKIADNLERQNFEHSV